ncbi:MAG: chromate efflux transporter, partial [Burkholderiaceae bacterium]
MPTTSSPPRAIGFAEAFRFWLKLGFVSFGGPAGQIALMHAELVERRRWISERRFLHALNYCMVLPGPEATQLAIYIGWLLHRTRGGIVAGTLFVLPSLAVLIGLSWVYIAYGSVPVIAGILYGIKPAVVAIVLAAAWRIASRTLKSIPLIGIALAAFLAIGVAGLPFPLVVLAAAAAGFAGGRLAPEAFSIAAPHAAAGDAAPALIDDATPTPAHARFSKKRLAITILASFGCGLTAWFAIAWALGISHPLAQMGWFFTKAAFLGFGGAYAVLPYVLQGAAQAHHWVTPAQMIDGLALGETTPGPLIMIVAFV